ncbi:MAG: hypothetical protein IJD42_03920 [Clostridia bacterium]|nr:hypothetical protein [Clostridia bacterium]
MVCTFFGHRDAQPEVFEHLKAEIYKFIEDGVDLFLIGNNGNFDFMVQNLLYEISENNPYVNYKIILSKVNELAISGDQAHTYFPQGFEKFPPKFAISKRNDWLIKNSHCAIVYAKEKFSNSYKLLLKSIKNGLIVINIANMQKQTP